MKFSRRICGKRAFLALAGAAVVAKLLPSEPLDPWGLLNLQKLGALFVAFSTVQLAGSYLAYRFGARKGRLLAGFLGGFVSSTAYAVRAARRSREHPKETRTRLVGMLASCLGMQLQAVVLLAISNLSLARHCAGLMAAMAVATVGVISVLLRGVTAAEDEASDNWGLEWLSQLQLALMIGVLILGVNFAQTHLGTRGAFGLTALASLFEVHGALIANSQLQADGKLPLEEAFQLVALGLVCAHLSKVGLAALFGNGRFLFGSALSMAVVSAAAAAVVFTR